MQTVQYKVCVSGSGHVFAASTRLIMAAINVQIQHGFNVLMLLSAPTSICKQQIHIQYQPGGWTFSPGHDGNPVQHVQLQYLQIFTDCTSIKCIAPAQGAYTNISIQGSPTKYSRAKLQASQNHTHTHNTSTALFTLKHSSTQCCTRNKDTINSTCGSGVEPASCYQKGTGPIPTVCMSKCPWARTPNCSWWAGRHHQCMNVCMNYCKVLWTKASA